jgi:hypothetical protein
MDKYPDTTGWHTSYCWQTYMPLYTCCLLFGGMYFNLSWCNKVCQWLAIGQWYSPGTLVSSNNKTDRHDIDIAEILLIVINLILTSLTYRKSLTNFIASFCIEYASPWVGFELKPLVAIGSDCTVSYKSNYHTITATTTPT